jgi:dolichol kinase
MNGKLKGSMVAVILAILAYFVFTETVHFAGDNSFTLSCVALFCFITQYFTLYDNMDKR